MSFIVSCAFECGPALAPVHRRAIRPFLSVVAPAGGGMDVHQDLLAILADHTADRCRWLITADVMLVRTALEDLHIDDGELRQSLVPLRSNG